MSPQRGCAWLRDGGNASWHERVVLCHSSGWSRMSVGSIPMGIEPFCWSKGVVLPEMPSPYPRGKDSTMGDTHIDPAVFKAQQREQWSNVAQGWRRRWAAFEQGAQPLSDRMMTLAHVAPGQRVLDVATGIGEPAMTAARQVGPSGSVVAIDQAPQMLAVARERMQAAGIRTVEFVEGDAEAPSLPLAHFDAVVCRWGLMFFHDPVGARARFRNSLVPRGWLAAAIWGSPERVPMISLPF